MSLVGSARRPALILLLAKKFFRAIRMQKPGPERFGAAAALARMSGTGQIFWLLAYVPIPVGITFFPPSPPKVFGDWPNWEVVSSYSSATAPDSHGISCADPLFQARKELGRGLAGLRFERQDYLINSTEFLLSFRAKSRHPAKSPLR